MRPPSGLLRGGAAALRAPLPGRAPLAARGRGCCKAPARAWALRPGRRRGGRGRGCHVEARPGRPAAAAAGAGASLGPGEEWELLRPGPAWLGLALPRRRPGQQAQGPLAPPSSLVPLSLLQRWVSHGSGLGQGGALEPCLRDRGWKRGGSGEDGGCLTPSHFCSRQHCWGLPHTWPCVALAL